MFTPVAEHIGAILKHDIRFVIPRYQRSYSWSRGEATELVEDLKSCIDMKEGGLFLGNFIFEDSEKSGKIVKVVDGQQRLTSLILLLIACRERAKTIGASDIARGIQKRVSYVDEITDEELGPRLEASESIREIFVHISNYDWDGQFPEKLNRKPVKRQANKIKPVYEYFKKEIEEYNEKDLRKFVNSIYKSYVVRISIKDETEALGIFERTNARGKDLEIPDLLKTFLFSQRVEKLDDIWNQIIANSDTAILRMLKYFYVSRNGYVQKSVLYKKIKNYGTKVGANKLLDELLEFSIFFDTVRNAERKRVGEFFGGIGCKAIAKDQNSYERIYYALEGLRLFNVSQIYPLLHSAIHCFVRTGLGKDVTQRNKLIHLVETLEKYHFINSAICGRVGNEVEKLYADTSLQYQESKDFEKTTRDLITELKKRVAGEDEFISQFVDIEYSQDTIPLICYIFDRINNFSRDTGQRIPIFNPDPKLLRKNHNIEHFYPQSPEDSQRSETLTAVHNIGILLVIAFRTNSKLGNTSPEQKIGKLKGELQKEIDNLAYVREFITKYEGAASKWDVGSIESRAEEIARESYEKIWKM